MVETPRSLILWRWWCSQGAGRTLSIDAPGPESAELVAPGPEAHNEEHSTLRCWQP